MHQSPIWEIFYVLSQITVSWKFMTRMVDILGRFKLILFWSGQRDNSFSQFSWTTFCHFGDAFHHLCLTCYLAICGKVTLLCHMAAEDRLVKETLTRHLLLWTYLGEAVVDLYEPICLYFE